MVPSSVVQKLRLPAPEIGVRYILIDALDEALTLRGGSVNILTLLAPRLERLPSHQRDPRWYAAQTRSRRVHPGTC